MEIREPKMRMRGTERIFHHLFKGQVSKFLKNLSWKKDNPNLTKVEHVHFFHTVNSHGIPQKFTQAVGGHFHEVQWSTDDQGNLIAKCGPPLKKVGYPGPDGLTQWVNEEIKFHDAVGSMGKRGATYVDDHTHEMVYMGSDELSPQSIRQTQTANRAAISDGLDAARKTLSENQVSLTE